jgi:hypothetical protein
LAKGPFRARWNGAVDQPSHYAAPLVDFTARTSIVVAKALERSCDRAEAQLCAGRRQGGDP